MYQTYDCNVFFIDKLLSIGASYMFQVLSREEVT